MDDNSAPSELPRANRIDRLPELAALIGWPQVSIITGPFLVSPFMLHGCDRRSGGSGVIRGQWVVPRIDAMRQMQTPERASPDGASLAAAGRSIQRQYPAVLSIGCNDRAARDAAATASPTQGRQGRLAGECRSTPTNGASLRFIRNSISIATAGGRKR